MKLKDILTIACFIGLCFSCSMDDERILDDISNGNIPGIDNTNADAFVAFNVDMGLLATKSETVKDEIIGNDNVTDQEINTLLLFLLDGENIVNKMGLKSGDFTIDASNHLRLANGNPAGFLSKKTDNLKLIVIANSSYTLENPKISACTTLANIKELSFDATDLEGCVKVSDVANVVWGDYPGYPKIQGEDGALAQEPCWVDVTLKQAYARVGLNSFVVKKGADLINDVDVQLLGATLVNRNMAWSVGGTGVEISTEAPSFLSGGATFTCNTSEITDNTVGVELISGTLPVYRTFQNTTASEVGVCLTYKIGVNEYTRTYPIKTPESATSFVAKVMAGNIYQLNIIMNVADREADVDVVCYTTDWKEGGSFEVDLTPSTATN